MDNICCINDLSQPLKCERLQICTPRPFLTCHTRTRVILAARPLLPVPFASSSTMSQPHPPPESETPAAVEAHPLPLQQQCEDVRVEALVAARLEQRLEAQLSDILDVVLASTSCTSSMLESAASMGRHDVLGAQLKRLQTILPANQTHILADITAAWHAAADNGHAQCLRLLLDSCTSPAALTELLDTRGEHGRTALVLAARQGHTSCVQLLLSHSPDTQVDAVDDNGMAASMFAALRGHPSCLQLLLQHNPHAQVTAVNASGGNALMFAAQGGYTACIELLLQYSPDVQVAELSDVAGDALCLAAAMAHPDCLQLLLPHGPSQHQLDGALHNVCRHLKYQGDPPSEHEGNLKKCMALLLGRGAMLTTQATDEDIEIVRPISQQLIARALVPDMANEAVVGMALAVNSRRRRASNEEDATGPSKCARPSC